MKNLFFLCSILCLTPVFAQTPLIAHKSHSGSVVNYFIDPSSNFGRDESYDPPNHPMIFDPSKNEYRYTKINDTMVYRITENSHYALAIDTVKKPKNISFRKFTKLEAEKNSKTQDSIKNSQLKNIGTVRLDSNQENENGLTSTNSKSKNHPSFLLIFFGVSAVGMIIMRLFRSSKDISPLIP